MQIETCCNKLEIKLCVVVLLIIYFIVGNSLDIILFNFDRRVVINVVEREQRGPIQVVCQGP